VKDPKFRKQFDNWFRENHLIINIEKNRALPGKRSNPIHRPFCLNGKEINYSSNVKYLGIYITENLFWATHTHHVHQKLNKALYFIKSLCDSAYLF
jgi:hypothetical protein